MGPSFEESWAYSYCEHKKVRKDIWSSGFADFVWDHELLWTLSFCFLPLSDKKRKLEGLNQKEQWQGKKMKKNKDKKGKFGKKTWTKWTLKWNLEMYFCSSSFKFLWPIDLFALFSPNEKICLDKGFYNQGQFCFIFLFIKINLYICVFFSLYHFSDISISMV